MVDRLEKVICFCDDRVWGLMGYDAWSGGGWGSRAVSFVFSYVVEFGRVLQQERFVQFGEWPVEGFRFEDPAEVWWG